MSIICPTITATDEYDYNEQIKVVRSYADRIHIDLMDGDLAPSVSPDLNHVWWPHNLIADIHLMYRNPMEYIDQLIKLRPHMVIIHNEASVHHMDFAARLHAADIKAGLAIVQDTPVEWAYQIMHSFDHVLVFSGNLGYQGGTADLGCIDKVIKIRQHHPEVEIGWDGGINDTNVHQLADAGVNVLNVGGFLRNAANPHQSFTELNNLILP